jgi:hypothetical protein
VKGKLIKAIAYAHLSLACTFLATAAAVLLLLLLPLLLLLLLLHFQVKELSQICNCGKGYGS